MKKLAFIMCALFMCSVMQAQERIMFNVGCPEVDDQPMNNGRPKSPMRPPVVYIEDYVLTFAAGHPDYELFIKDEDGEVVYSTTVTSAETLVTLPSFLAGDYVIELTMGNWKFTGWIEL